MQKLKNIFEIKYPDLKVEFHLPEEQLVDLQPEVLDYCRKIDLSKFNTVIIHLMKGPGEPSLYTNGDHRLLFLTVYPVLEVNANASKK